MNKATFFIAIIISVILVSGIRLVMNQDDEPSKSTQSSETKQADETDKKPKELTTTGTYDCLSKRGNGPQTMECALGLLLDDGTQYALGSDDPALFAGVSTGTRIEVTGSVEDSSDASYETAGTIEVQSYKQL